MAPPPSPAGCGGKRPTWRLAAAPGRWPRSPSSARPVASLPAARSPAAGPTSGCRAPSGAPSKGHRRHTLTLCARPPSASHRGPSPLPGWSRSRSQWWRPHRPELSRRPQVLQKLPNRPQLPQCTPSPGWQRRRRPPPPPVRQGHRCRPPLCPQWRRLSDTPARSFSGGGGASRPSRRERPADGSNWGARSCSCAVRPATGRVCTSSGCTAGIACGGSSRPRCRTSSGPRGPLPTALATPPAPCSSPSGGAGPRPSAAR
mmetsp:Transcript_10392/g.18328  ORF Transcript_10392/g.18328 Transcript_10392/m.18328 type:complete len:259 (-) Transcript_10392:445-1221(-)